jgi:hypothetical protein
VVRNDFGDFAVQHSGAVAFGHRVSSKLSVKVCVAGLARESDSDSHYIAARDATMASGGAVSLARHAGETSGRHRRLAQGGRHGFTRCYRDFFHQIDYDSACLLNTISRTSSVDRIA